MGIKSRIEWTNATWNPIRGCSRVSEGCRNCYAERVAARFSGPGMPYEGLAVVQKFYGKTLKDQSGPRWTGEVRLIEEHLEDPLRWKKPRRIFVNSMSDLFHENVKDEWIARIFAVMAKAHWHTFQVLTKRPERMRKALSEYAKVAGIHFWPECQKIEVPAWSITAKAPPSDWPLKNVWLGVSVENQKAADERIPLLLQTPAAVRFISAEPLLGPIHFKREWWPTNQNGRLDWLICGGESGPGARPMHPDWARSLRDQCQGAGVPFFFKQWGEWVRWEPRYSTENVKHIREEDGTLHTEPIRAGAGGVPMARIGKKDAGRLLDGSEWSEFPRSN